MWKWGGGGGRGETYSSDCSLKCTPYIQCEKRIQYIHTKRGERCWRSLKFFCVGAGIRTLYYPCSRTGTLLGDFWRHLIYLSSKFHQRVLTALCWSTRLFFQTVSHKVVTLQDIQRTYIAHAIRTTTRAATLKTSSLTLETCQSYIRMIAYHTEPQEPFAITVVGTVVCFTYLKAPPPSMSFHAQDL